MTGDAVCMVKACGNCIGYVKSRKNGWSKISRYGPSLEAQTVIDAFYNQEHFNVLTKPNRHVIWRNAHSDVNRGGESY